MKKTFLLLVLIFSTSMLLGAFDIKLGVFKNIKNLRVNIAKVKPYTFRKQIIVKKRKSFYYTYAIVKGSRSQATKALKAYQHIFKDAFIAGQIKPSKKIAKKKISAKKSVRKKRTSKKVSVKKVTDKKNMPIKKTLIKKEMDALVEDVNDTKKNTSKIVVAPRVMVEKKVTIIDIKEVLSLKTVYLCYEGGPAHLKHRVVQMTFNEDTISYNPLGEDPILDIAYKMEENKVVLTLMDTQMTHKIVDNQEDYLSVKSYVGDKKMHTLRYYFNESLAVKYVKGH
jgi:hypothetical protein